MSECGQNSGNKRVLGKADVVSSLFLFSAVFAVFAPSLCYPLLAGWDDHVYVTNAACHLTFSLSNVFHWFTRAHHGCYLPLTMLSYMLDHSIWGLDGAGYHLQNILWHSAAALGVFACLRASRLRLSVAFVVSLFFALHPQRIESVVWISERKDVMCAAFYFWSVYCHLRGGDSTRWRWLSFALFVLAFLSKPMAISLPFVLFLLDYLKRESTSIVERASRLWPYVAVICLLTPLTYFAHLRMGTVGVSRIDTFRQFAVILRNILWYAWSVFDPRNLSPIYPRVSFSVGSAALIIVSYLVLLILGVVAFIRRRELLPRIALVFSGCYLISLLPIVGVVPFGFIDYADRYSYIPSFFILLGIAMATETALFDGITALSARIRRLGVRLLAVAGAFYILSFVFIDLNYMRAWRSVRALHEMALTHVPPNSEAVKFLADMELASGHYRKALALARLLRSMRGEWMTSADIARDELRADYLAGAAYYQSGRSGMAFKLLRKVVAPYRVELERNPSDKRFKADYKTILLLLASLYDRTENRAAAAERYSELSQLFEPGSRNALYYRGVAAMRGGRFKEAATSFKTILRQAPKDIEAERRFKFCVAKTAE